MADQYYDPNDLIARGDRMYDAPGSSAKPYIVDMRDETCTCTAFAINRNKSKTDSRYTAACKHTKAAVEYERLQPPSEVKKKAAAAKKHEAEQEEAAMEFQKIRMREQLRRELERLREDV